MATERPPQVEAPKYKSNEAFGLEKPDVDCGSFTISFSDDPRGFEVENPNSFTKIDDSAQSPLRKIPKLEIETEDYRQAREKRDLDRSRLRESVIGRFKRIEADVALEKLKAFRPFQLRAFREQSKLMPKDENGKYITDRKIPGVADALDQAKRAYNEAINEPEAAKAMSEYQSAQQNYMSREAIVTGTRNFRRNPKNRNVLIFDTRPAHFGMSVFANQESSPELQEISGNSSSTMVLETSDNKLILGYRHKDNYGWPHTPAASASGYMDAIPFRRKIDQKGQVIPSNDRRKLRQLTTKDIKDNALRELDEELGIKRVAPDGTVLISDEDVKIAAMVHERGPVHDEFLILARTKLTAAEVIAQSEFSVNNEELPPGEFREKSIVVDATPEVVYKLVAESKCPLPKAHNAVWQAKGYELMLRRGNIAEAKRWRSRTAAMVAKNYEDIDKMSNGGKYDLRKTPEQNGVPTFDSEMKRLGIIT